MTDSINPQGGGLIPVFEHEGRKVASGREIHAYLGVATPYAKWFARMVEYGFTEGQDYVDISVPVPTERTDRAYEQTDHAVTIDMAKELGMIQRTPAGKTVRQYFIDVEKRHQVAAFDPNSLDRLSILRLALEAEEEKKVLESALESAAPAIEYHDRYVANSDTITIETWGRQYGLTRTEAFDLLRGKNFIFKKSMGEHYSNKKGRVVEEFEHRARQGKPTYPFFTQLPHNKVDRHYNGQVRQTLYVRQAYAIELAKACGLVEVAA